MPTRSNFARCEPDDLRRVLGLLAAMLALCMAVIWLRVAFVSFSSPSNLRGGWASEPSDGGSDAQLIGAKP